MATAGILAFGLWSMVKGNAVLSQRIMRARVVAQGVTVALVGLGSVGVTTFMPKKAVQPVESAEPPPSSSQ